ncbi:hypothetical protein ACJRO7_012435 [Eucalyptus globulus]|uniref:Uncharacterized protein n=1 Tax=Eucalyptus globulus TaxID=34317 RepID=A0ABD3LM16_EUCGL
MLLVFSNRALKKHYYSEDVRGSPRSDKSAIGDGDRRTPPLSTYEVLRLGPPTVTRWVGHGSPRCSVLSSPPSRFFFFGQQGCCVDVLRNHHRIRRNFSLTASPNRMHDRYPMKSRSKSRKKSSGRLESISPDCGLTITIGHDEIDKISLVTGWTGCASPYGESPPYIES